MTVFEAADIVFKNLQPINSAVGFLAGMILFGCYKCDTSRAFECVAKAFTFTTLPSGFAFVFTSGYPAYVSKIPDVTAAFFVGGCALVIMPFVVSKKISEAMNRTR
ncbi:MULTISPECIES: hypothetical protein [unclassified Pseudomonas]|uniref:hypothetical protein n=1 Tax=unclassified Pseudomonas TaxID=196821 RepID=UPI000E6CA310|nr:MULTISPECIES: hypothetical protein [unclassified Pseudomonas]NCE83503.1 hypothetical protein [Pseudomonas sp. Q1]NWB40891.1 hypothetical protein [Pseudomonas sp. E6002]